MQSIGDSGRNPEPASVVALSKRRCQSIASVCPLKPRNRTAVPAIRLGKGAWEVRVRPPTLTNQAIQQLWAIDPARMSPAPVGKQLRRRKANASCGCLRYTSKCCVILSPGPRRTRIPTPQATPQLHSSTSNPSRALSCTNTSTSRAKT